MTVVRPEAIVIGASAGAIDALSAILPRLPKNYPLPVMVVIHIPGDQKSLLVELFSARCQMKVQEPDDKEPIRGGVIYLAPPDYHLLIEQNKVLSLSNEEPVSYCRPSIDVLFDSAADAYKNAVVGVILTGANHDGAEGLRRIAEVGGETLVQEPNSAFATAMPEAALASTPAAHRMGLNQIAEFLLQFV